ACVVAGQVTERDGALEGAAGDAPGAPHADGRAGRRCLAGGGPVCGDRLPAIAHEAAGHRTVPDTFCYGVRCDTPPLDVELPEMQLSDELRGLLERTLAPGARPRPGD
ncbi:MAG TPA: hypothetical protein VFI44_10325, partial [Ornithinibacter sp.]|nr:hypothetical protein [Ornithinibacter sp.]